MKKEWIVQLIVLLLHYFDTIKHISHGAIHFTDTPSVDFFLLLYHLTLFLIVCNILIPRYFYKNKFGLFFSCLFGLILIYSFVEETVIEQILDPTGRGNNTFSWKSIYFFLQENAVPLLAFISIKFVFDNFERQQKLERIEKDSLTNELKFLKAQIQPHILFNSLNSLYDYTLSKSDKAPELVLQLSNVLRYVLYETSTAFVPLSKEIKFIKDYIALQEMQLEGRGTIQLTINSKSKLDTLRIAPFLLIPFIENSFKHSLGSKERDIFILIELTIQEENIQLLVENNFEATVSSSNDLLAKGIGLKNVEKRLALLYPEQYQLTIIDTSDLYKVQLDLTIESL